MLIWAQLFTVIYNVYSKSIETEDMYTKIKLNTEWNVNFLQNVHLLIMKIYFQQDNKTAYVWFLILAWVEKGDVIPDNKAP